MIDGIIYPCINLSVIVYSTKAIWIIQCRKAFIIFHRVKDYWLRHWLLTKWWTFINYDWALISRLQMETFTISDKPVRILGFYAYVLVFYRKSFLWENFQSWWSWSSSSRWWIDKKIDSWQCAYKKFLPVLFPLVLKKSSLSNQ